MSEPLTDTSAPRRYVTFAVFVGVLGLTDGVLWHFLATPPSFTIGDDLGAIITERGLSQTFAMDVWFVLLGTALGLLLGVATRLVFPQMGWQVVAVGLVAAMLAGFIGWQFGHLLGPRDFADRLAQAKAGDRVPMDLDLHDWAVLLVWPTVTSLVLFVAAVSSALRSVDWHHAATA